MLTKRRSSIGRLIIRLTPCAIIASIVRIIKSLILKLIRFLTSIIINNNNSNRDKKISFYNPIEICSKFHLKSTSLSSSKKTQVVVAATSGANIEENNNGYNSDDSLSSKKQQQQQFSTVDQRRPSKLLANNQFYLKKYTNTAYDYSNKMPASPHILPGALAVLLPLSLIVWVTHYLLPFRSSDSELSPLRCFLSILVPSMILYNAAKNKKLDAPAMMTAFVMGFIETLSNLCMIATTVAFFLAGTRATKFKRKLKDFDEEEEEMSSEGRRNWIQVISNGGVGMEISILLLIEKGPANELPINFLYDYFPTWLAVAFLGSMACACGDTLASELAPALSSAQPRLITSPLTRVPKGTNGGVTILGLICSALGGFICGLTYYIFTLICVNRELLLRSPPQWPLILVGTIAGLLGSVIDSLIGATVQFSGIEKATGKIVSKCKPGVIWISGLEILDNHSVNLTSTLITALITPYFGRLIWANL